MRQMENLLPITYELCRHQERDGSWNAFRLRPGGSGYWTTAAALLALASASNRFTKKPAWLAQAQNIGWDFLKADRFLKPIGFNQATPCDADSTIWLARALTSNINSSGTSNQQDPKRDWLNTCLDFIESHIDKEANKVCTYKEEDGILDFVNRQCNKSSWLNPHDCVTANAIALGKELAETSSHAEHQNAARKLLNLTKGEQAFWWTTNKIIPALLKEKETNEQLILRVPNHEDPNGLNTNYSMTVDVEAGIAKDNGSFSKLLKILSSESKRKN